MFLLLLFDWQLTSALRWLCKVIFAIIIIVISGGEEGEIEADVVPISMRNTPQSRQLPTLESERGRGERETVR